MDLTYKGIRKKRNFTMLEVKPKILINQDRNTKHFLWNTKEEWRESVRNEMEQARKGGEIKNRNNKYRLYIYKKYNIRNCIKNKPTMLR